MAAIDAATQETNSFIAEWLVNSGFPFDFHTTEEPPLFLLREVIKEWCRRDGESYGDYSWSVRQDTGWKPPCRICDSTDIRHDDHELDRSWRCYPAGHVQ